MLEPWIIEQIRRREEEERRRNERPQLEIPAVDERQERWRRQNEERERNPRDREKDGERDGDRDRKDDEPERGVMIIDFGVG
jgi:hypothetical protein